MTLTWPDSLRPSNMEWALNSNAVEFRSPFNGATQTVSFPGSAWSASLSFDNLDDAKSRKLEVLLARLDGMAGRILIGDFGRFGRAPQGAPKVDGAANTGMQLKSKGWTASRKVLWEGDYISVGSELKLVLEDVWSDTAGKAIIPVGPMWRNTPKADAVIETANPVGLFRLSGNENGVTRQPAFNNNISLKFIEAI